jgi:hypothetical protein
MFVIFFGVSGGKTLIKKIYFLRKKQINVGKAEQFAITGYAE